jgi:hypothetical protein
MRSCTTILILLCGLISRAQYPFGGTVVDKSTREPLEGAVIRDLSSGKTTLTDRLGHFLPVGVAADSLSLDVSYIGYRSRKIRPGAGYTTIELEKSGLDLTTVTITGNSAFHSLQTLSRIDLNLAPARSAQDLLRLVPGLFIAQHQGGGKAEQIFLRGFDADHGTDVNILADGIPVNMVSHAHGQGYADLHFLIPETINRYDFGKGPYYADKGDFTTAGYVAYHTMDVPDHSLVKIEGGQFHTGRFVTLLNLFSQKDRDRGRSAWLAGEGLYADGPFHYPEHFNRVNLFAKFITRLNGANRLTVLFSTLTSHWRASGEIPGRAIAEGYIPDRFGVIDSAQGGFTSRTNASLQLQTSLPKHFTLDNQVYYSRYLFNLISDFTFYYFYPQTGDQFRQQEARHLAGTNSRLSHQATISGASLTSTIGAAFRYDEISPSLLAHTLDGYKTLGYVQLGRIRETNLNAWIDESLAWGKWLFSAALRWDYLHFYYGNHAPANDSAAVVYNGVFPKAARAIVCPKLNIQYAANSRLQFYVRAGKGFHSNDARIVIANKGYHVLPDAWGADAGINWKPLPGLFLNTTFWYLYLQQEFAYGADLGDQAVSPGGRTSRKGFDLALRYQWTPWLFSFLNIDLAKARAKDAPKEQNYLPLAPGFTSTGGVDFHFRDGLNGRIGFRYMRDRPANEVNTLTAQGYWVSDLSVNYTKKSFELGLTIENLFDVHWNESQFAYSSQLKYERSPVDEVSFTPGSPFFLKLKYARFF